jgi:hypothetical protein
VEGNGDTDPDFLDDPSGNIPGSVRLDNREQLVRESIRESFSWWRPRSLPRFSGPAINDLVAHRWHGKPLTPEQEVAITCRVQAREGMAFDKLLAGFQRNILKVANGHMPRYWRPRRLELSDKHTNNLLFEDLVAAGVAAMWKAALKFDLESSYRFWTGVRAPVLGAISDEARLWRRHGSGESRLDRWLYTHPTASPEQVLRAQQRLYRVEERLARWLSEHPCASPPEIEAARQRINKRLIFHSLQEAAEGIKLFWAWRSDPEFEIDEAIGGDFDLGMYSCFSRYTLSPQLRYHEPFSLLVDRLSGGLDTGPDVGNASKQKEPHDLLDYTEPAFIRFKNGKRQVSRQKAASYCYGILVTPELEARALRDLEFAAARWESRTRRSPLPAKTYPRWSTKFGLGRVEHENRQIVPAYIKDGSDWFVRYRSAAGELLSVLESPSLQCLKPKPCEFCEEARSGSRANNVPPLSILSAA